MYTSKDARIGQNVEIRPGAVIEAGVTVGDGCLIDYNAILRPGVTLGADSFVGANSILGEYQADYLKDRSAPVHPLTIGSGAVLRSGSILYGGSSIGEGFSTGHRVTLRERCLIGDHVSIGTLSDLQGFLRVGSWVHMHSNVHIGQKSTIGDYVWIFPYTVLTNDPTPPSDRMEGVTLEDFSVLCTGSIILPGLTVGRDALVGAGALVTKSVAAETVVLGNPAKPHGSVRDIRSPETGLPVYPWRYSFCRGTPWQNSDYDAWQAQVTAALEQENTLK